MIHLKRVYIKKENHKVKVEPFDFKDGIVHYSSVGYLDWRQAPEKLFLERFELEVPDEITYEDFMKAMHAKVEAELIISRYNLQESKKINKEMFGSSE